MGKAGAKCYVWTEKTRHSFSREEDRLHIHVQSADGEAKFFEPKIALARNHQLSAQDLSRVLQLVIDHEQEIRDAWHRHFGR